MKTFNDLKVGDDIYIPNGEICKITEIETFSNGKRIYFEQTVKEGIKTTNCILLIDQDLQKSIYHPISHNRFPCATTREEYERESIKTAERLIEGLEWIIKSNQKVIAQYRQMIEDIKSGKIHTNFKIPNL